MKLSRRLLAGPALVAALWACMGVSREYRLSHASIEHIVVAAQASGPRGILAFAAVQIGVAALGILPASLLAAGAGLAYGFWLGAFVSIFSTMLGGWIAFVMGRSVLRPWIERFVRHGPAQRFDKAVACDGWRLVCLMRVSPIMPFAATSYGLGLTKVSHRAFLLGTLASLPALLGYVAVGAFTKAGLALGHAQMGLLHGVLLGVGAIATVLIGLRIQQMLRSSVTDAPDTDLAIQP